ncbi:MAG: S8 family serine peptidase, partial [Candidatus Limnocylindrales bacterium]
MVVQVLLLALALSGGPVAAANPGHERGPGLDPPTGQADVQQVLRGSLRRLAAGGITPPMREELLRGTVTAGSASALEVAVTFHLDGPTDPALLAELARRGARVANVASGVVEAYVSPDDLVALAQVAGVRSVRPILAIHPTGFVSPAVALHGANTWQTAGYTGAGVKIGIIDGGFTGLAARLGTELPATVQAHCYTSVGSFTTDLSGCDNGETHGTAVAETVFDMAPGAQFYVASPKSRLDEKAAVAWMTSNGVKVINASFLSGGVFDGPGDGTSPYSNASYAVVNQTTAAGALWVNSAGNSGDAGWTGGWTDVDANGWLEFATGDERNSVTLAAGQEITVAIRWADPWRASANDYDLALYSGDTKVASGEDVQAGAGDPWELIDFTATAAGAYDIAINRVSGAATSRMQLLVHSHGDAHLTYQVAAGTLPSPADSSNPGMLTVGAVDVATPGTIETYSSRGPTLDGRVKPDLVAADCAATTVDPEFCGTSESAPFVAGAAALVLQAFPSLTPSQLGSWLRTHAVPLGSPVPNSIFGWGRLDLGPLPVSPVAGTERYAGTSRFATAAAISAQTFVPGVAVAYIAYAYNFPDALAGAAAAGTVQGPVLLANSTGALDPATIAELTRLQPHKIIVLGGTGVISDAVRQALAAYATSGTVVRYAGTSRFATAAAISAQTFVPGVAV